MEKNEFIITIAKDILVAAITKDSQVNLGLSSRDAAAQLIDLGERLKTISKAVETALDGLKD